MLLEDQFKKEWNIDPEKKIITCVFAWSAYSKLEVELNLNTLFDTISRFFNDSVLIIKPHPGDKKEHIRAIYQKLSQGNVAVRVLPLVLHTLALLYVSDLVITQNSTAGMEAVALGKPLIILNLSGESDK